MSEHRIPHRERSLWTRMVGDPAQRTPVLCIPGGPGCAHHYIASVAALAERGRPVVLYDPYGAGASPAPPSTVHTVSTLRDGVEAVRDGLGLPRVHVFAHSAGAFTAIEYALAQTSRVASLVLSSPIFDVAQSQQATLRLIEQFGPADAAAFVRAERDPSLRDSKYLTLYYRYIAQHVCRFADARAFSLLAGRGFDSTAHRALKGGLLLYLVPPMDAWSAVSRLATLDVPILVICGAHDVIGGGAYESIAGTLLRARVSVFERSSHVQHLEEPARFLDVVGAFLDECDA